jgi:hypothetical protein
MNPYLDREEEFLQAKNELPLLVLPVLTRQRKLRQV